MARVRLILVVLIGLYFSVPVTTRVDASRSAGAPVQIGVRIVHPSTVQSTPEKTLEQNVRWGDPFQITTYGPSNDSIPGHHGSSAESGVTFQRLHGRSAASISPGVVVGQTVLDNQYNHSAGYQVGRAEGASVIHFCWGQWFDLPFDLDGSARFVAYDNYDPGSVVLPIGGTIISLGDWAQADFPNLDVRGDNTAQLAFQQRPDVGMPLESWHLDFPLIGPAFHIDEVLPHGPDTAILLPRIEVQESHLGSPEIYHVLGHDDATDFVYYWRFDGASWQGPVIMDRSFSAGYVLASDTYSDRVAAVLHVDAGASFQGLNLNNVAYYESTTRGAGWIDGSERGPANRHQLTSYDDPDGPQAWVHLAAIYDHSSRLHVLWDEQRYANASADIVIRHWNSERATVRPVTYGYWPSPQSSGLFNLNLAKMTIGVGDGSSCSWMGDGNLDYLYVVYTQFSGLTQAEQEDYSAQGYYNGELYLTISDTHGDTWTPPTNLTNTKTPGCDPGPADPLTGEPQNPENVCGSEHWASVGRIVGDLDVMYISDRDAGGAPHGQGSWQNNEVMYLGFPGGGDGQPVPCPYVAPRIAGYMSAQLDCPYQAVPGEVHTETLTVINTGNAPLQGNAWVSLGAEWLSIVPWWMFTILPGGSDYQFTVEMASWALPEGIHYGEIVVEHDDPSVPSPLIFPVEFHVFYEPVCYGCQPSGLTCPACVCICHGDPQCDGVVNVLDIVHGVNVAFRGDSPVFDSDCSHARTDVDCNGFTNVLDIVRSINVAFKGAFPVTEFCDPCGAATSTKAVAAAVPPSSRYRKARAMGQWCGAQPVWEMHRQDAKTVTGSDLCSQYGGCDDPAVRDATVVNSLLVGVIVHVIHDGSGEPTAGTVNAMIDQMNRQFADNCTGIQFCLSKLLYHQDAASAWIGSGSAAYADIDALKLKYAESPGSFCNIYITGQTDPGTLLGLATFPWDPNSLGLAGGMWLNREALVDGSHVATHEMGHCLGLWHTHHGVTEVPEEFSDSPCAWPCYEFASGFESDERGDLAGDTPPTPVSYNCTPPGGTDCQANPWGHSQPENFMGYAPDSCVNLFTQQQTQRMQCWTTSFLNVWLKTP